MNIYLVIDLEENGRVVDVFSTRGKAEVFARDILAKKCDRHGVVGENREDILGDFDDSGYAEELIMVEAYRVRD